MPDPADDLITAWIAWEEQPSSKQAVAAKHAALHNLNLDLCRAHEHIATWRRTGYSIPDAVQSLCNDTPQEAA